MIVGFKGRKDLPNLLNVIRLIGDKEFYITENNQRIFVNNEKNLNILLKNSHHIYYEENELKTGVVLIWKSYGGDKTRQYVKLIATDHETAKNLITILLWNYENDLFVKLKKDSKFISAFREKGFKFAGGRGTEILMIKTKYEKPTLFKKEIVVSNNIK